MSEDQPNNPQDGLPVRPEAEDSAVMDVSQAGATLPESHQPVAETALSGAVEDSAVDTNPIPESAVVDRDKAEAMAWAGKENRELAAEYRENARTYDRIGPRPETELLWAEGEDEQAERVEEWAGILHDHPPSEAFTERYGALTPSTLVHLEEDVPRKLKGADDAEAAIADLSSGAIVFGEILWGEEFNRHAPLRDFSRKTGSLEFRNLVRMADSETRSKAHAMVENGSTTFDELASLYKELVNQVITEPVRAEARITQGILDDIKSGRASTYTSQETSAA